MAELDEKDFEMMKKNVMGLIVALFIFARSQMAVYKPVLRAERSHSWVLDVISINAMSLAQSKCGDVEAAGGSGMLVVLENVGGGETAHLQLIWGEMGSAVHFWDWVGEWQGSEGGSHCSSVAISVCLLLVAKQRIFVLAVLIGVHGQWTGHRQ